MPHNSPPRDFSPPSPSFVTQDGDEVRVPAPPMQSPTASTISRIEEPRLGAGQATEAVEGARCWEATRILARRACDACRARRRKCFFTRSLGKASQVSGASEDHPQPRCHDCERLGINCSFLVPTRTRGPKRRNRLLNGGQNVIRDEMDETARSPVSVRSGKADERSPSHQRNAITVAASQSQSPGLEVADARVNLHRETPAIEAHHHFSPMVGDRGVITDELCRREVLEIIIGDYLDFIYPLVPVVHRPTFRAHLASHRDAHDAEFFELLLALTALTIGLLPSRFPYYQSLDSGLASRFQTRTAMINFCAERCAHLRTVTYWDHVSQRKWAVCYCISVACFQTGQTNRSRMFEIEAMQVGRLLGIHRIADYEGLNCIETQLRKKAFWLLFYTAAHAWHQCCGRQERLSFFDPWKMHEINFEALFPLEVDDEQIFEHEIRNSPSASSPECSRTPGDQEKIVSSNLTSGFNIHTRVFFKSMRIALAPGNSEWEHLVPPEKRLSDLRQLLDEVRYMLDDIPSQMRQWAPWATDEPAAVSNNLASTPSPGPWDRTVDTAASPDDANARALPGQLQTMRANLHGTHLWVQSAILDRIDIILQEQAQQQPGHESTGALKASWLEREDVCRQMLHLLHSMPYDYQEPNGLYLAYKVRDVGVALLNCPFDAQQPSARRAAGYIQEFAQVLSRLDRSEMLNMSSLKSWVDTDREKPVIL